MDSQFDECTTMILLLHYDKADDGETIGYVGPRKGRDRLSNV